MNIYTNGLGHPIGGSKVIIWWLVFEKKPFQFWREIWIQVVVIVLQLYLTFRVVSVLFFHQICCSFWSPQNEFLLDYQNIQKMPKCQNNHLFFMKNAKQIVKRQEQIDNSGFVKKRFMKRSHVQIIQQKKVHDYQSINLVLIWKPLDILNERTINRMIDSAIYSWWSGQIGRAKDCGPSLNTKSVNLKSKTPSSPIIQ